MLRLLIELWPALLPLLLYVAYMRLRRGQAVRKGNEKPAWRDGPWFWALMASFAVGAACLFLLGATADSVKGPYVPPHLENGRVVPGQVQR